MEQGFSSLEARASHDLADPQIRRFADVRYSGQSFELTIAADDPDRLVEDFNATHETRYGFALVDGEIEVTSLRVAATTIVPKPEMPSVNQCGAPRGRTRSAYFEREWRNVPILYRDEELTVDEPVRGPAIIELPGATCVVRPAWVATMDRVGAIAMERP
jgi:N-methylhydantoinase A